MTGGFVLIVGPSGAGKDTLIGLAKRALSEDGRFLFPRRLVTRPRSPWEDHDTITPEAFELAKAAGRFCLSWHAHGLCYAIGTDVLEATRLGRIAVCNVSRRTIEEARRKLQSVAVVEVTGPPDILAQRLAARGREEDGNLLERIARSRQVGEVQADVTVINDRAPEDGAFTLVSFLRDRAAKNSDRRVRCAAPPKLATLLARRQPGCC